MKMQKDTKKSIPFMKLACIALAVVLVLGVLAGVLGSRKGTEKLIKVRYDGQTWVQKDNADYDSGNSWATGKGDFMDSMPMYNTADVVMEEAASEDDMMSGINSDYDTGVPDTSEAIGSHGKKIAYEYDYEAETTAYDDLLGQIEAFLDETGGYIESNSVDTATWDGKGDGKQYSVRRGYYTIRFPAEEVAGLREILNSDLASLFFENAYMLDRTESYFDAQAHVESLEAEYKTLEALLPQAVSVTETIEIQDRLTSLNWEIDNYKSQMAEIDDSVLMSTADLTLYEVIYYHGTVEEYRFRFGQNFAYAFENFINGVPDFLFNMIYVMVAGIVIGAIVFVWVKLILQMRDRKKAEQVIRIIDDRKKDGQE